MAGKPTLGKITQADHGILMSKAYTHMLMENPNSVLKQRDWDMLLYDELLRDDQLKPCFQQRQLAVTQSEWDVEPASESSEDKAAAEFIKEQPAAGGSAAGYRPKYRAEDWSASGQRDPEGH